MKYLASFSLLLALLASLVVTAPAVAAPQYSKIPVFKIESVSADKTVTIRTHNLPAHDSFVVLMGPMHTRGVHGIKVATVSSKGGGTLKYTFKIPAALKGSYRISIRMQSNTGSGYYAYNWFYNNNTGTGGGTHHNNGYRGIPTFRITGVKRNKTVTIQTHNLPPKDKFKVLMGPMSTRGVNGYHVDTINTGNGGSKSFTFNIPHQLKGSYKISIRLQSVTGSGYYAYNWFYNNTTH
jgi:hypothetical protein